MGGSGGGYFSSQSPESIRDALRKEEQATEDQLFDTQVANDIALLLGEYNNRDTEGTRRTLDRLKKALEKDIDEGSVTPIFGGSVRKHTYVDGISDIDCLFVLKGEEFAGITPGAALGILESKVEQVTPEAKVDRDKMSLRIN